MPREEQSGVFCGFPIDFWHGLTTLRQSMLTLGYSRSDYGQYEEWFVLGKFAGFWDRDDDPFSGSLEEATGTGLSRTLD